MDSPHRIQQTSMTLSQPRQTPKTGFAEVFAGAALGIVKTGAALVGAVVPLAGPLLSTAVTRLDANAGAVVGPPPPVGTSAAGGDLVEAQRALQSDAQQFNLQYLQM